MFFDSRFINTKREAFHSLLQKFLYPSTRLRSNLISRPNEARAVKVNLIASVPKDGIPLGNSFWVCFFIFSANFGCIMPWVLLSRRSSRPIPSIRSIGSRTLPLDLLIFWPLPSLMSPVMYISLNGTSPANLSPNIIIRATQKNMISKPVTRTLVG